VARAGAGATPAPTPSRQESLPGAGSQGQGEHQCILALRSGGVIASPQRDVPEAEARIKRLRGAIARPHLEVNVTRTQGARDAQALREQRAAIPSALAFGGHRKVQQVCFSGSDDQDEIAEQARIDPIRPAFVAGAQRVREVAARPGMLVDGVLDLEYFSEFVFAHPLEARSCPEYGAHRAPRSSIVSATLSRR